MVTTLSNTSFETAQSLTNALEQEKTNLSEFEHQLTILFSSLRVKYEGILFKLENSDQLFNHSISTKELSGLFKIVLEAIDNSIKHSNGSIIKAEVKVINHYLIQFLISDNGAGFDLEKVAEKNHSGLRRICDLSHQIDARVVFDSTPGKGTQVVVAKSLEKQKARFYTRLVALF
jgi:signal transduction histidine kinase